MADAMSTHTDPPQKPLPAWLWRRADQATLAALACAALVALTAYGQLQGGWKGRLIEIDREPRRSADFVVDINRAEWPELAQLPEIGESLARRIVETRRLQGPYLDHEDLRRVRGIGPKTLERIRPYLRPLPPAANIASQ
jgi:competence protein ComEA